MDLNLAARVRDHTPGPLERLRLRGDDHARQIGAVGEAQPRASFEHVPETVPETVRLAVQTDGAEDWTPAAGKSGENVAVSQGVL